MPGANCLRKLAVFPLAAALAGCGKPSEPVTLRYAHSWMSRPDDLSRMDALSRQFTQETGVHIKHIPTPESTHDFLNLSRKLLMDSSSGADVLATDVIWSSILAPDLVDLRADLTAEIPALAPQLLSGYTVDGKLVAAPNYVPIGGLEYRADLLREYGYDHPPKTWDELERMAEKIQTGERAKGRKDFWGFVWQGPNAEALTCNALEWQAAEGGGRIVEEDRTISVNNPAAIRAWQRAKRWIGWISPPGVLAFRERDSMNVFDSGGAAFDRIWLVTPVSQGVHAQRIGWRSTAAVVPTGFARIPGGPGGSAGTLGGNGIGVSRHSVHRKEAVALVRFLLRAQIQASENAREPGGAPVQLTADDPPSIDQGGGGIVARPSGVSGILYEQITKAYFSAVHSVLAGEKDAPQAAAELEKALTEITGFRAGQQNGALK